MTWEDLAKAMGGTYASRVPDELPSIGPASWLAFTICADHTAPVVDGNYIRFPCGVQRIKDQPTYYGDHLVFDTDEQAQVALTTYKLLVHTVTEPVSAFGFSKSA